MSLNLSRTVLVCLVFCLLFVIDAIIAIVKDRDSFNSVVILLNIGIVLHNVKKKVVDLQVGG